jgi:hypothetical protein
MAEEKKVEAEPVAEPKPEEVKPISKEEYEQLRSEVSKMEQNWKDAQRVISKKDEELSKLKDRRDFEEAMLAAIAESKGGTVEEAEQEVRRRQPDLQQQYQTIRQRRQQGC